MTSQQIRCHLSVTTIEAITFISRVLCGDTAMIKHNRQTLQTAMILSDDRCASDPHSFLVHAPMLSGVCVGESDDLGLGGAM